MKAPFDPREAFGATKVYRLLPFRSTRLDDSRHVITNDAGEHLVLDDQTLRALVDRSLAPGAPVLRDLEARHFLFHPPATTALDLLALKWRTRLERLAEFTSLHIFVLTLRCEHNCHYCQVSRQTEDRAAFDMSREDAERAVELVFESPARRLKIEFQGGEPLLAFELLRHVVLCAEARNATEGRDLGFVVATNLALLSDEMLAFFRAHRVHVSTSLDGPRDLHERQRPRRGGGSHALVESGVARVRAALGADAVSALMTTTPAALREVEAVIDEYVRLGFHSIFLRPVSPFGFAVKTGLARRYDADAWLAFYRRGLDHILAINRGGYPIREEMTAILLQKMRSTEASGYVDLQSPAGAVTAAVVYNYDGRVYASDEGRMLAEMGNHAFALGHVRDSYDELFGSEAVAEWLAASMTEGAPMCSDCAFLPWCGADPVYHVATQGDVVGHKAFSEFCRRQTGMLRHIVSLLEDDPAARDVLEGWA